MVRKLHLEENVISDLYGLKIINMDAAKQTIISWGFGSVNLNDCSLVPIDKPRTYAAAKKSDFPIIGVRDNMSIYQGWNKPSKKGTAVMGVYGRDNFMNVAGDDKVRSNFEQCERFYQVVPNDIDTYQSQYKISQNRTRTVPAKLSDTGNVETGWDMKRNTLHKSKAFTQDDLMAYDPEVNRRRYVDILTKNHLNKFVSEYNDACATVKAFQNRLNNVDIATVSEYSYGYALDAFKKLISALKTLNSHIKEVQRGVDASYRYRTTEKDLDRDIEKFDEIAADLAKKLSDVEK